MKRKTMSTNAAAPVVPLRVYLAEEGEAAEQQEMPLDAFNAPCERRDKILASLVRNQTPLYTTQSWKHKARHTQRCERF